ncbi:MAG: iron-containing alcohol dehydrogenase [Bacteroidales bacterium]|nr:iron-containing alcohol dehydrogenase [Bacteroidales bacterium]
MENFVWENLTKLYFGKDAHQNLKKILPQYGKKYLLLRGKSSVEKNGILEKILIELQESSCEWIDYSGIKSNPSINEVRQAIKIGRKEKVDAILAVGGGSVIDSAKAVAAAFEYEGDPWDLFTGKYVPVRALPIIVVLTLAATGSEMNCFSVVQNEEEGIKTSFKNSAVYPKVSILNPEFTFSVPRNYTAYGLSDIVAHALEAWFGVGDSPLMDKLIIDIIQEIQTIGPDLLENLHNYELRARAMFTATIALNQLTLLGRKYGDWGVHSIGHVFSLLYDLPHGATLSLVYPAWLNWVYNKDPERVQQLSNNLFNVQSKKGIIEYFKSLFRCIESPVTFEEANISHQYDREKVLSALHKSRAGGYRYPMQSDDYYFILDEIEKAK